MDHGFGNRDFSTKRDFPAPIQQQEQQQQAFNYNSADFPQLPTLSGDHQNWPSSADIISLQQDISLLKQHCYAEDGN